MQVLIQEKMKNSPNILIVGPGWGSDGLPQCNLVESGDIFPRPG